LLHQTKVSSLIMHAGCLSEPLLVITVCGKTPLAGQKGDTGSRCVLTATLYIQKEAGYFM